MEGLLRKRFPSSWNIQLYLGYDPTTGKKRSELGLLCPSALHIGGDWHRRQ